VLAVLGIVALVLAFGPSGQLYRLQQFLPLVSSFRCPCRYIVLFQLVMLILSAAAFGELVAQCRRGESSAWRELRGLGLLALVALAVALAGFILRGRPLVGSRSLVLAGAGLLGAAVLLVALAARGHRGAVVGLVVLTAADLGVYGLSYAVFRDVEPLAHYASLALVPPDKPERRMAADLIPFGELAPRSGNQMLLAGWSRVDGYAGLEPAKQLDYRQLSTLRVAGVRWVRRTPATEAIRGLEVHDARWLRVPDPLDYVRLASAAVASRSPAADLRKIPIESTVLVEQVVELPPDVSGSSGVVRLLGARPGRLTIDVESPGVRLLAVAESFHGGWQASIDGRPAAVLRVNGDFMGCQVGPGRQRVVLEFRPESLRRGMAISLVGVALVVLAWVRLVVRSRPTFV
jgi:hypothetical protein